MLKWMLSDPNNSGDPSQSPPPHTHTTQDAQASLQGALGAGDQRPVDLPIPGLFRQELLISLWDSEVSTNPRRRTEGHQPLKAQDIGPNPSENPLPILPGLGFQALECPGIFHFFLPTGPQSPKGWEPSSQKMGRSWQLRPLTPCPK